MAARTDPFDFATGGFTDLLGGVETLFGSERSGSTTGTARSETTGEARDRLEISDEAIDKIVSDILSGPEGLASIFAGEQAAGVFNTSVAAQAAGDLTAKITGEIAKLRAERVRTQTQTTEQEQATQTKEKKKGLLSKIFGF